MKELNHYKREGILTKKSAMMGRIQPSHLNTDHINDHIHAGHRTIGKSTPKKVDPIGSKALDLLKCLHWSSTSKHHDNINSSLEVNL